MAKIIPNKNSWIGFAPVVTRISEPLESELSSAVELTKYVISITASAQGNTVPTPSLDDLFETSIPGTSAAQFSADFYRDDTDDVAWETLTRGAKGFFVIARFGTDGAEPAAGDKVEVWPVTITSRAAGPLSSNTAQTFTVTCAVTSVPSEDAAVVDAHSTFDSGDGGPTQLTLDDALADAEAQGAS